MRVERIECPQRALCEGTFEQRIRHQFIERLGSFDYLCRTALAGYRGAAAVDLGGADGMFSRIAQRHGLEVVSVDARPLWREASPTCEEKRTRPGIPRAVVPLVSADIRCFDLFPFDLVFAIGVLYHLRLDEQSDLMRRRGGRPMVIDTELYDVRRVPPLFAGDFETRPNTLPYGGALFRESNRKWSSVGNTTSFWFTEDSIIQFLADHGAKRLQVVDPPYWSRHGLRRWYVIDNAG